MNKEGVDVINPSFFKMKYKIIMKCNKCDNESFLFRKLTEDKSEELLIYHETLCHDGFGYDLNTFEIICSKCKSVNSDIFKIQQE